jgi:hypothetical protein
MATTETTYRNRRAVRVEDDQLCVTVLVEGGHIAEILHKATGENPLWSPPWPSIEPSAYNRDRNPEYGGDSESKLLAGIMGHNLALDIFGPPSPEEHAAGLTVHGEASTVPWVIEAPGVGLRARARLPLSMLEVEREIRLAGGGVVRIVETVTNLTAMDRPIAWTQHVTLGPPFIEHGQTRLLLPCRRAAVYPHDLGPAQALEPKAEFSWPHAPTRAGATVDLSVYPATSPTAALTGQLVNEGQATAFFLAWHPRTRLLFGYAWHRADFPWVSLWLENKSRPTPPWNGETVTWGLEFGASPWAETRRAQVDRGSLFGTPVFRWLPAAGRVSVTYTAFAREAPAMPSGFEPEPIG